jgi:hypothetical protein
MEIYEMVQVRVLIQSAASRRLFTTTAKTCVYLILMCLFYLRWKIIKES